MQQIFKQTAQKICVAEFDPALIFESMSEINSKESFWYKSLVYKYNVVTKISAGLIHTIIFSTSMLEKMVCSLKGGAR